jgi:hypothetical protein
MPNTINIGRKDVLWNYAATFLQIGVGVILLPFILRVFPQETVAIWTILHRWYGGNSVGVNGLKRCLLINNNNKI